MREPGKETSNLKLSYATPIQITTLQWNTISLTEMVPAEIAGVATVRIPQ